VVTLLPQAGEKGIKDVIDLKEVFPVGRLDKDSSGLIILTNDGRITDRLLNPKYEHEKEYIVETKDKLRNNFKEKMESGVDIGDYVTQKCKVEILGEKKFSIILGEGKKHQIRRMCVALFNEVKGLKRIRIMNIKLGNLAPNAYRKIEDGELKIFLQSLSLL
jgi:23S rRNA pseudouridine2604 synthase